jgi:hypothetical protein
MTYVEGDLLYHAIHGLCRIDRILSRDGDGKQGTFYSLSPRVYKKNNPRYVFSAENVTNTGFHAPISVADANAILAYFKKGLRGKETVPASLPNARSFAEDHTTWELAKFILGCAHDTFDTKDKRKRETLKRATRGLIIELAFVLQVPLAEAIFQVRKSLEHSGKVEPLVLAALTEAGED